MHTNAYISSLLSAIVCVLEQYYFTAFVKSNKMVTHTLTVFVNTSRNDFVSRFNLNYINC